MTTITERHYNVAEAVFLCRLYLGPLCNWHTTLADIRRGRETLFPNIRHRMKGAYPYYVSSDLMQFVDDVRHEFPNAKSKVPPVFADVDLDEEITL